MSESSTGPSKWESVDTDGYDNHWTRLESAGHDVHGEADFVSRFGPSSVLDAGCGTGRVAIELARRGCDVAGVDLDEPFIAKAQAKAPDLDFRLGDLSVVQLDRTFDAVVMAGNVMIFVKPGTEAAVITNMANHVSPGGHLIAGFQLGRGLAVSMYNDAAESAGLSPVEQWSTWDRTPSSDSADYAVVVHRMAATESTQSYGDS